MMNERMNDRLLVGTVALLKWAALFAFLTVFSRFIVPNATWWAAAGGGLAGTAAWIFLNHCLYGYVRRFLELYDASRERLRQERKP